MTLTPWFPGDVKPARIGVYQRSFGGVSNRKYAYWDGEHWRRSRSTPDQAALWHHAAGISPAQLDPFILWRGLAEPA